MDSVIFDAKYILFTGAGFTANFGGFLANEMWAHIFNQRIIQSNEKVRDYMLKQYPDLNFEMIYQTIMASNKFDENDKTVLRFAIDAAFSRLDTIVLETYRSAGVDIDKLISFIDLFIKYQTMGIFFTINQDLFIERIYNNNLIKSPGVRFSKHIQTSNAPLRDMGIGELPNKIEIDDYENNIKGDSYFYIKLHGSQNWLSPNGMVIGGGKKDSIDKVPILKWYFNIIESVLNQKNRRLLIIGYGFKDEHINKIISDAVRRYGLKLYLIHPSSPSDIRQQLLQSDMMNALTIWHGLSGYYPYLLREIFPQNNKNNIIYSEIIDQFFK